MSNKAEKIKREITRYLDSDNDIDIAFIESWQAKIEQIDLNSNWVSYKMKDIKYDIIFHTQLSPGLRRRLYIAGPEVDPSKMMDQINKEMFELVTGKYPAGKTVDEMLDEIEGKTKDGVPTNYNLKKREDRNRALPTPNVEPSDHLTDVIEQGREVKNEGIQERQMKLKNVQQLVEATDQGDAGLQPAEPASQQRWPASSVSSAGKEK